MLISAARPIWPGWKEEYAGRLDGRLGRGVVFHIAPSNVPINFAYSLTAALLSGNGSIVKASSRDFLQTRIVCRAMEKLLTEDFAPLAPYVCVVTYPREAQEVTEAFSARCDAGSSGAATKPVRRVREAALPPRAVEVAFADPLQPAVHPPRGGNSSFGGSAGTAGKGFL